ncbi:hypothetical pox protein [Squirrelpox virus]|uniref:C4R n=1 Tax=Squirrelpox virus TaxID=240426 RepID=Q1HTQ9_9POXV|nr:hypothetical pox protein [Squirrelpox virus]ABD51477.1 C4R [Squirrelpox virus]CCD83309.1 hypothetical pox protein [Squirrelpox virus]
MALLTVAYLVVGFSAVTCVLYTLFILRGFLNRAAARQRRKRDAKKLTIMLETFSTTMRYDRPPSVSSFDSSSLGSEICEEPNSHPQPQYINVLARPSAPTSFARHKSTDVLASESVVMYDEIDDGIDEVVRELNELSNELEQINEQSAEEQPPSPQSPHSPQSPQPQQQHYNQPSSPAVIQAYSVVDLTQKHGELASRLTEDDEQGFVYDDAMGGTLPQYMMGEVVEI